jgi:serine/threonine-protein kinase
LFFEQGRYDRAVSLATPLPSPSHAFGSGAASRAAAPERLAPEQGKVLAGKYVLERPAGFGGMAELWVATNQSTGAEVCIKLLVPNETQGENDEEAVERFRREAHAAARLSHRAIVKIYDLLELDRRGEDVSNARGGKPHAYAIVMELLRGETLGDLLMKRGKLPVEEALDLFLPVVSALGHAHRAEVIHRDLKPDNIFLATEPDGQVIPKVLDFGVSKLQSAAAITIDGVLVGTPSFMSPEQARGARQIDARSDVFSAGILLYMMLDGNNPFADQPTFASTVDAILRREIPVLADVPEAIWEVLAQAIAKEPVQRFNDGTEMAIALRKATGRPGTTGSIPNIVLPLVPAEASVPPEVRADEEAAVDPAAAEAASRRRMLVVGVLAVCSILGVVAVVVTVIRASGAAPVAAPGSAAVAVEAPAPDHAMPASTDQARAAASANAPEPAPPEAATAAAAPKAKPAGRAGPKTKITPAKGGNRKSGSESHIARDPGF